MYATVGVILHVSVKSVTRLLKLNVCMHHIISYNIQTHNHNEPKATSLEPTQKNVSIPLASELVLGTM